MCQIKHIRDITSSSGVRSAWDSDFYNNILPEEWARISWADVNNERIEKHHRIPRNMGGLDTYNNLVCLKSETLY